MNLFKRIFRIVAIGAIFGFLMLFFQKQFGWSDDQVFRYYRNGAIILVVVVGVGGVLSQTRYYQKLIKSQDLLKQGKVDEYIQMNRAMLAKTNHPVKQAFIKLNLAAGYGDKGDYEKGLELLDGVNPDYIQGINKGTYYTNKIYFLLKLGRKDEALKIYFDHEGDFPEWKGHPQLAPHFHMVEVMVKMAQGKEGEARVLLREMKAKNYEGRLEKELNDLAYEMDQDKKKET